MNLARLPAVRDRNPAACNALFTDLLTQRPRMPTWAVIDTDGNVLCSAFPITDQIYAWRPRLFSTRLRDP